MVLIDCGFRSHDQDGTKDVDSWESTITGTHGSVILAGFTRGSWGETIKGGSDFAALSLDATGMPLWAYQVSTFCRIDTATTRA